MLTFLLLATLHMLNDATHNTLMHLFVYMSVFFDYELWKKLICISLYLQWFPQSLPHDRCLVITYGASDVKTIKATVVLKELVEITNTIR